MLDQIRGRSYEEALMLLEYMPFRACEPVLKTILSVGAPVLPVSFVWHLSSTMPDCVPKRTG